MAEQNQESPLKPGEKFGALRREYSPLRKRAGKILEQEGVAERPFKKARAKVAREFLERQRISDIDSVTGLPVRRLFEERLEEEVRRARRYNHPLTMVIVDVNDLKKINAQGGLPAGDKALKEVADNLKKSVRGTDFVARYGGDEYAGLFPETPLTEIDRWWERFKETMGDVTSCTVSAGATEVNLKDVEGTRQNLSVAVDEAKEKGERSQNVIVRHF